MCDLAPDPDDVVQYVDKKLLGMTSKGESSLVLKRSGPLPKLRVRGMDSMDYDSVTTRLKLLADVKSPACEGRIVLYLTAGKFDVRARFDEGDEDRLCELTMSRRN